MRHHFTCGVGKRLLVRWVKQIGYNGEGLSAPRSILPKHCDDAPVK